MGILYIVATPIGNLKDMTPRAIETLKDVDIIAVEDTRQTIKLLNAFDIKTKMVSYHKFNERTRSEEIIEKLKDGLNIALVSDAGTPCISDPGYVLVKEVREKGIEVIGIPGSSALITALSISGISVSTFSFYGFLPTDTSKLKKEFNEIKKSSIPTFIFYESPRRIVALINKLQTQFPNSIISICSDMTKKFERNFFGKVEDVYEMIKNDKDIEKGEYVVVMYKEKEFQVPTEIFSIEARIIDVMIKSNYSMKEAIQYLNKNNENLRKSEIYNASLNLKKILNNE